MKKNYFIIIMGLLLVSIAFNIKYLSINKSVEKADIQFLSKLDDLNKSFKFFKENQENLSGNIRNSSSQSGQVLALCKLTSYYNKNIGLFATLSELNLAFLNLPEDKILTNIEMISDYIIKIYNSPTNCDVTDEFKQFLFEITVSE